MKPSLLDILTLSEKRKNLLLLLLDGAKTLDEIRTSLGVTSTGMLPQIRKMEERNLVRQEDRKYALTAIGKVIAELFQPLVSTIEVIEQHEKFWYEHDVEVIPLFLLKRLSELGECKLITSRLEDLYEPHREFMENIQRSKEVMGISPVFHPSYPPFFLKLAEAGRRVSLILTDRVFNRTKKEYRKMLQKFLALENTNLFVSKEDIRLACAVTDRFLSRSFFFKDGSYDAQRDLISFNTSALKWGRELFNYYLEKADEVKSL